MSLFNCKMEFEKDDSQKGDLEQFKIHN